MPDGLTGPRGLAPSGKDPPWHPNPSPAAAHLARLLEGRNGMGDAWLAQTRFRCDSGVPVLPTTRIPLEAYNVADRTLPQYGATTRTRLSLPLGTQGPVPAVGLKPQERRASARRSREKDGQNERRRVKATDDGPPMRRRGGMRPETLGMSPRDDHLVILATQGRNCAAGFGDRSTLGLYRPPAPRLGAGATTILARFFAPSACTGLRVAPMRRYMLHVGRGVDLCKTGTTHAVKPPVLSLDLGRTSDTPPYLWRERSGRDTKNPKKKEKRKKHTYT